MKLAQSTGYLVPSAGKENEFFECLMRITKAKLIYSDLKLSSELRPSRVFLGSGTGPKFNVSARQLGCQIRLMIH